MIIDQSIPVSELSIEVLISYLKQANEAYRKGQPVMSDETYDHVYYAELIKRDPNHLYLRTVEPEAVLVADKVRHKKPMLSTDKAYTQDEINSFIKRVVRHAEAVGIGANELEFRITPKLDGVAAKYENNILATRGNGLLGSNISRNLARGLVAVGGENTGVGEIVLEARYFDAYLKDYFSHPRNFVTGLISADTLSDEAQKALKQGVVRFVPYTTLDAKWCNVDELSTQVEALCQQVEKACEYPVDGSVIDLMNPTVQKALGSTNHHHNWQIAKKTKGKSAITTVRGITWKTGRTGRITPVLNVETINLSGADISNVTAHNAGNMINLKVGIGAQIEIVRSGEVIPKLLAIVKVGEAVVIPEQCPACGAEAKMEKDFLVCQGESCSAQIEARLQHFFSVLGNVDLFGPKTIKVLVSHQITQLDAIYKLSKEQFEQMGFGPKQSVNLVTQLERSRTEAVEDWRFLAAFGINHLGRGDARKLLKIHPLIIKEGDNSVKPINQLNAVDIAKINGFGPVMAESLPLSLQRLWGMIESLLELGFNLIITDRDAVIVEDNPISGKSLVFTGSMMQSRNAMKATALSLGAKVQSSVNKKTDILIIGDKVGAKKIEKANELGTKVMSVKEYLTLIGL